MVFAEAGDRVWVTTSRGSVKARAWARILGWPAWSAWGSGPRSSPGPWPRSTSSIPRSWGRSFRESPVIALAAARYTKKNARFFAGYAVDANHVPLAWTPPGRVFAELRSSVRRGSVGDHRERGGSGATRGTGSSVFRVSKAGAGVFDASSLGPAGRSATPGWRSARARDRRRPGRPAREMGARGPWGLRGPQRRGAHGRRRGPVAPAALCVDRPSSWRAREMVGTMIRGRDASRSRAAPSPACGPCTGSRAVGVDPASAASSASTPNASVWWGWDSGRDVR